jgi:transposase
MAENSGVDVGKRELVAATQLGNECVRFPNDPAGRAQLVVWAHARAPERIVVESTSAYHLPLALALAEASLPVIIVNPGRVHAFTRGLGRLAKTDALDAHSLARFAATAQPVVRPIPTAQELEFKALVGRRRQLKAAIVLQRNQREAAPAALHAAWFDDLIAAHETLLTALDAELAARIAANAAWAAKTAVLQSIPGIGAVTAAALLAGLPELGQATHREIAALAGLAPHDRQSGGSTRPGAIGGGRAEVRTALYLPALTAMRCNPVIQAFAHRLADQQKATKVIIVACMHKLLTIANALLRDGTVWNPPLPT